MFLGHQDSTFPVAKSYTVPSSGTSTAVGKGGGGWAAAWTRAAAAAAPAQPQPPLHGLARRLHLSALWSSQLAGCACLPACRRAALPALHPPAGLPLTRRMLASARGYLYAVLLASVAYTWSSICGARGGGSGCWLLQSTTSEKSHSQAARPAPLAAFQPTHEGLPPTLYRHTARPVARISGLMGLDRKVLSASTPGISTQPSSAPAAAPLLGAASFSR